MLPQTTRPHQCRYSVTAYDMPSAVGITPLESLSKPQPLKGLRLSYVMLWKHVTPTNTQVLRCVCGHTQTRCTPTHTCAQVHREDPCVTSVPVFQGRESSGHPTRHQLGAMNAGRFAGPRPATSATFLDIWVFSAAPLYGTRLRAATEPPQLSIPLSRLYLYTGKHGRLLGDHRMAFSATYAGPANILQLQWLAPYLHTDTAKPRHCNPFTTPIIKKTPFLHASRKHVGRLLAAQARYKQR